MDPKRRFDCFGVLGRTKQTPLWNWKLWSEISSEIDEIIQRSDRGVSTVRCTQENIGRFRAGRITWSEGGHEKWTHASPVTKKVSAKWEFTNMEAWVPGPTTCLKDELPPDVFVTLCGSMGKDEGYSFLLLAIAEDFKRRSDIGTARAFIGAAAKSLDQPIAARLQKRPWGIGNRDHFGDAIQDFWNELNFTIMFRIDRSPVVSDFPWGWSKFKL